MGRSVKILIAVLIVLAVGVLAYLNLVKFHEEKVEKAVTVERRIWEDKTETLEQKVDELEKELSETADSKAPEQKLTEALGEKPPPAPARKEKRMSLEDIEDQIMAFFAYLDRQPYVASYGLEEGTYSQYRSALADLAENSPVLIGETDSLHRLYKNMAHFYRVLGGKRIGLILDVLENESEIIETVMKTFYTWYAWPEDADSDVSGRPDLDLQYTYAAYFLNTLSGRSYLIRRDSRVRALTYYYAVLILDRANDEKRNSLGLDIRPHIKSSYRDIRDLRGLKNRRGYLKYLDRLAIKYKMV
jgi:hypothetical protein